MNLKFVTFLLMSLTSNLVLAHGMNKLGPNGGYIKMPAAYHTELVDKGSKMHVYLLDVIFKNPIIEKSSVKIKYIGNSESEFLCVKSINHFVCDKPKDALTNYKEIVVNTVRNGTVGKEATYALPLKLEK